MSTIRKISTSKTSRNRFDFENGDGFADAFRPKVEEFPANTPVKEMTAEQQVAYWKASARKHEDRAKRLNVKLSDQEDVYSQIRLIVREELESILGNSK